VSAVGPRSTWPWCFLSSVWFHCLPRCLFRTRLSRLLVRLCMPRLPVPVVVTLPTSSPLPPAPYVRLVPRTPPRARCTPPVATDRRHESGLGACEDSP